MRKNTTQLMTAAAAAAIAVLWIFAGATAGDRSAGPATAPANTRPATRPAYVGPDVVIMKELVDQHEPVPFDHRTHAEMAEMWHGCVTCHHRSPDTTTRPAAASQPLAHPNGNGNGNGYNSTATLGQAFARHPNGVHHTQDESATIPACKSCHPIAADDPTIGMPNLKGAYHRQCLNCHKEWMGDNACDACHRRRDGKPMIAANAPTKDDIVGRMHPPIPEPQTLTYKTRFTPAVGEHVVFRHTEHTGAYGLRCVSCHHQDTCASCHDPKTGAKRPTPMKPGRTWKQSHSPCINCHQGNRCNHCHYKDGQPVPPPFDHAHTGQPLDDDHVGLDCFQCHTTLKSRQHVTCGGAECHPNEPAIAFPDRRPGPVHVSATTRPVAPLGPTRGIMR